jgi:hypothetical protein
MSESTSCVSDTATQSTAQDLTSTEVSTIGAGVSLDAESTVPQHSTKRECTLYWQVKTEFIDQYTFPSVESAIRKAVDSWVVSDSKFPLTVTHFGGDEASSTVSKERPQGTTDKTVFTVVCTVWEDGKQPDIHLDPDCQKVYDRVLKSL